MAGGEETIRLEELLRKRGIDAAGNPAVERELLERFQDTCAVMVLDSSGFTRLTRKHGIIHFMSLIVAMRDIIEPIVESHDALAAWSEADNSYAVFPSAKAAVRAGVEIQRATEAANQGRADASRLWVSVGIGFGKVLRIGTENVWGDEMNLASKLGEDTAEAREVLITDAAHEDVGGKVDDLSFEPQTVSLGGVEIPYFRVEYGAASS